MRTATSGQHAAWPITASVVAGGEPGASPVVLELRLAPGALSPPVVVEDHDVLLHVTEGSLVLGGPPRGRVLRAGGWALLGRGRPYACAGGRHGAALLLVGSAGPLGDAAAVLADPSALADDRAAVLAAAGIRVLPRSRPAG